VRIIEPVEITPALAVRGAFQVAPNAEPLVVQVGQDFMTAGMITNVPEADYPVWAPTTTYAVGAKVIVSSRIYEALVANTNVNPTAAPTAPPKWLDLGATNRWRMFDDKMSSVTTNPESISLRIVPGKAIDALAFFGIDAASVLVRVTDPYQGVVFESQVSPVSTDGIDNWYDYFFSPVEIMEDFVVLDVPAGSFGSIEIVISKPGGVARAAMLIIGKMARIGAALYGSSVGITDFSKKERDEFGNFVLVERGFSKRAEFDVAVETARVGSVQRTLARYRAKPLVWIGEASYEGTIIYGYYRDFSLVISGPSVSDCSISVEGLI